MGLEVECETAQQVFRASDSPRLLFSPCSLLHSLKTLCKDVLCEASTRPINIDSNNFLKDDVGRNTSGAVGRVCQRGG